MRLDFRGLWDDNPPRPPWLIPKIMTHNQLVILAGDAGVGKSMLSLFWAQSLASGNQIFGEIADPTNALYINEENSYYDMRDYIRKVRYGIGDVDEGLLEKHLRIEQFTLTMGIGRWFDTLNLLVTEHRPHLIVIDTATPACQITDEDKNGEASVAIGHLRHAIALGSPGCGMLVLKHSRVVGKGEQRTIRGAKAWKGSCDSLVFHTRAAGRPTLDGLHTTFLWPDKARAFGLREKVKIVPERVWRTPTKEGIRITFWMDPEV